MAHRASPGATCPLCVGSVAERMWPGVGRDAMTVVCGSIGPGKRTGGGAGAEAGRTQRDQAACHPGRRPYRVRVPGAGRRGGGCGHAGLTRARGLLQVCMPACGLSAARKATSGPRSGQDFPPRGSVRTIPAGAWSPAPARPALPGLPCPRSRPPGVSRARMTMRAVPYGRDTGICMLKKQPPASCLPRLTLTMSSDGGQYGGPRATMESVHR